MSCEQEIIARRLLKQAEWCQKLDSPLYARLLREAAADVRGGGVCWEILQGHHGDPPGSALALRFLGAVHRLVLQGKAPQLAACYPSAGGNAGCDELWPRFRAAVQQHAMALRSGIASPVQTNEVGRCVALLGGFLAVARRTSLPLRLLEIGASAGLILRWDHYFYEEQDGSWGDPHSPVRFFGTFKNRHPDLGVMVKIVERWGCDTAPVDAASREGELTLKSYIWPDQEKRFHQLAEAISIARRVPVLVKKANAADWIETALAGAGDGVATVLYHSIVWQYLSPEERGRIERAIIARGEVATTNNPLAWLRLEPGSEAAEVRLQLWPGGEDCLLARSGFHGKPVEWLG